ncbi:MAG: tetratricopeptide repeat protein [Acidobacteria bacterium]|nr:tetratricopeptide repeat protein [Acidobacteriota bacterium]
MESPGSVAARPFFNFVLLVALGAGWMLLADRFTEPPFGLGLGSALIAGALVVGIAGWLGWGFRQVWLYPPLLQRAEALWARGGPPEAVEALLLDAVLARGELGFRIHILRGHALLAQDRRDPAWRAYLQGELARLPWVLELLVAPAFRIRAQDVGPRDLRRCERLHRLAPRMSRLCHLRAVFHLQDPAQASQDRAWRLLSEALPQGAHNPLLLEDVMLAGLGRRDESLWQPALALLGSLHLDPRLPWDRCEPAAALLAASRPAETLALIQSLAPAQREELRPMELEAGARRMLGDLEGADAVIEEGLRRHPGSFRLWMESHLLAVEDRAYEDARSDLEEARRARDPESLEQGWEWELRAAEFAWWVDGDAERAHRHLALVPPERRGEALPPLELHLQVARGEHDAAFAVLRDLLKDHPAHLGLLLLQAECLAGMQAWESLLPFLEQMEGEARERAEYWHLRGLCLAHHERPQEARDDLERAARMDPGDLRLVLDAGHACAELGEWERSEFHWRQALHLDGACEEALVELAESRRSLHDEKGALRLLRECLLLHPESAEAQARLAELEAQ